MLTISLAIVTLPFRMLVPASMAELVASRWKSFAVGFTNTEAGVETTEWRSCAVDDCHCARLCTVVPSSVVGRVVASDMGTSAASRSGAGRARSD